MKRKRRGWMMGLLLISGLLALGGIRAVHTQSKTAAPVDIAAYVPLDNGRTWTYEWTVRFENGRKETVSRTKSFEGPEFLATGYAYKFMSDLGDYSLLSVENQQLRLHGSVEPHRNIRFTFDPPVVLYSPDMEFGRPYAVTQPAEDGNGTRSWTTVVDGFEDVNTPVGKFNHCLKLRLEMISGSAKTRAVYYYARGLGLVAYQYEAWSGNKERPEVAIDAVLKLAQLMGQTVTSASQLETLNTKVAASPARLDDPEARKTFRQSYEALYFWPARFPGFQADFTLRTGSDAPDSTRVVQGVITVTPDLKMKVSGGEKQATVHVETEMSQFITHLKDNPFDNEYKDAVCTFGDRDPVKGTTIEVVASNTMGTSYRIKDGEIHQIGHSYGRVRFLVNHTNFMKADEGRLIPTSYSVMYYSNETDQLIDQVDFKDQYTKVETIWLPKKRVKTETAKNITSTLEVEFTNHRLLK